MTDTGQVPGEGLPENAGMVEQPGIPAPGAYTFLDPSENTTEQDDDLLLMPGAQGAWSDPQVIPAPQPQMHAQPAQQAPQMQPVAQMQQAPRTAPVPQGAEPGAHEAGGRDSGSVNLNGVRMPQPVSTSARSAAPASMATPPPARRPLHLGPQVPDGSAGVVRSLADRGPAGATPAYPVPLRNPGPATTGPEYLDISREEIDVLPGPQLGAIPSQVATPWPQPQVQPQPQPQPQPQAVRETPAETVVPEPVAPEPAPEPPVESAAEPVAVPAPTELPVPEPQIQAPTPEPAAGAAPEPLPEEAVSIQAQPEPVAPAAPEPVFAESPALMDIAPEQLAAEPLAPSPMAADPVAAEQPAPEYVTADPAAAVAAAPEPELQPQAAGEFAPVEATAPSAPQPTPTQPEPIAQDAPAAVPEQLAPEQRVLMQPAPEQQPLAEPALEPQPATTWTAPEAAEAPPTTPHALDAPGAESLSAESGSESVSPEAEPQPVPEPAPAVLEEPPTAQPEPVAESVPEPVQPEESLVASIVPAPRDAGPAAQPAAEPEPEALLAPEPEPAALIAPEPEAVPEYEFEAATPVTAATAAKAVPDDPGPAPGYNDAEREAVLRVMRERRDIRNGFRSDPIPHEVLLRVLEAAHTAPSVGHSQPWDFVVIRSAETRRTMHELAQRQRDAYAKSLPKGRAKQFKELKIEAILDTPVNIVVTADPTRGGRHTLGRHTQPQMAPYSSALAVENLWLAARAEGLGVGWVSFFDEREMVRSLGLPEHLEVVAYLCVGYVDEFPEEPELMQAGWSKKRPLSWVVHEETYGRRALPGEEPHDLLQETVSHIRPLDAKALGEAWERQKRMTKPAGALGMLEIISAQLSGLSRMCPPPIPEPAAVAIFAGDHGVHAQGVTAWPQEVTAQMVANFLGGGAVVNAFASQVGAEVCVVDVGVAGELPATPGLLPRKVRAGTADFTTGPALTHEEVLAAIEVGIETARDLVAAGNKALITGEMGIANTTVSAALISVYTGVDPAEVTGRGTGINDEMHARKIDVVRRALELHQPDPADPIGVLAAVGGLEHAALVGFVLGGASLRTPVILDGVSAGAAALVARAIAPEALAACIAGHRSAEPGHVAALNKLGLRPLVDLDLRLGEGTGALLALPVVQSAARAMHEVATFDSAGVTEK
ncbi:nicotinate-nucleotide--dimethylbenzimidazole phosphoribosyltransferase [Streptomyces sp. A5-4]|uniref:nicotinate-nucleotide--dimethylbenzimidazole phosphoribosyltransferase n=1 Tax=Streptomyces sp. A5-4 TaxID=3384771 RepID=UPI003DAA0231